MNIAMATILGKTELTVKKLDGTEEKVEVIQFHLDSCQRYLELLDDEMAQAEFLCQKPAGWAKALTIESIEKIIETGEQLNWGFFERWLKRRLKRLATVTGGVAPEVARSDSTSGLPKPV